MGMHYGRGSLEANEWFIPGMNNKWWDEAQYDCTCYIYCLFIYSFFFVGIGKFQIQHGKFNVLMLKTSEHTHRLTNMLMAGVFCFFAIFHDMTGQNICMFHTNYHNKNGEGKTKKKNKQQTTNMATTGVAMYCLCSPKTILLPWLKIITLSRLFCILKSVLVSFCCCNYPKFSSHGNVIWSIFSLMGGKKENFDRHTQLWVAGIKKKWLWKWISCLLGFSKEAKMFHTMNGRL